jgi:hypothetical protein
MRHDPICIECGGKVTLEGRTLTFEYGTVPNQIILAYNAPLFTCSGCDSTYTDWQGESAREFAIRAHLMACMIGV